MSDLTTVEAVKGYAGIKSSADDAAIATVVRGVSALIAAQVGHDFEGEGIAGEPHYAPYSGAIIIDKPASAVAAVRVSGTTIDSSGYRLRNNRMLERLSGGSPIAWTVGATIEVDYVTTSEIPADLGLAAAEIAAFVWKQTNEASGGGRLGLSAQANGDSGSADYFTQSLTKLPVARMALRNHRAFV